MRDDMGREESETADSAEKFLSEHEKNKYFRVRFGYDVANFFRLQLSAQIAAHRLAYGHSMGEEELTPMLRQRFDEALQNSSRSRLGRRQVFMELNYRELNSLGREELTNLFEEAKWSEERKGEHDTLPDQVKVLQRMLFDKVGEMEKLLKSPLSPEGIALEDAIEFGRNWLKLDSAFVKVGGSDNVDLRESFQRLIKRGTKHAIGRLS